MSTSNESAGGRPADSSARRAGAFLLLTAGLTVAMVVSRVLADADQSTLAESLARIDENRGLYATSGATRLLSGLTLAAAAWLLLRTWIIRERLGTPLVPVLFAASGAFTAVSGACALALAVGAPAEAGGGGVEAWAETADLLRWSTGKVGFAAAGIALLIAARYQWKAGGPLRRISPATAVIGLAMQFIWVDAATLAHPIIGTAFFLWLTLVGAMLLTGRVERQFVERFGGP